MTTSGWCSRAPAVLGEGSHPLLVSPNESRSRPRRFSHARRFPGRYLLFSLPVRDPIYGYRATRLRIVFAQHAIQAPTAAIVVPRLSFGSCNWKFNASIYCNPSQLLQSYDGRDELSQLLFLRAPRLNVT